MTEVNPPNWMQGGSYLAEQDRQFIGAIIDRDGVVVPGALLCTAVGGMTINIAKGAAFISGTTSPTQGTYHCFNDADKTIDCATADGANDRLDAVVGVVQDTAYDGSGLNQWQIQIITGTPSGSPALPTLPDSCQLFGTVLVKAGHTDLTGYASVTDNRVRASILGATPVGCVMDFAGSVAPAGWFFCDGSAKNRLTFSTLFNVIGTVFGVGDGTTTFNLPDYRGRYGMGMGGHAAGRITALDVLGSVGGTETVTLTTTQLPSHLHSSGTLSSTSGGLHNHAVEGVIGGSDVSLTIAVKLTGSSGKLSTTGDSQAITFSNADAMNDGAHTHATTGNTGSAGSGGAHPNLPPYIMVNKIIKF